MKRPDEMLKDFRMLELPSQDEVMRSWPSLYERPKVSIRCLTYNHERFIEDTIKGFLIQKTDFPFEILIHDDASKDKTADILRRYEKSYPKVIKVVFQEENQYSRGINPIKFLHEITKGEYIAACEGDDFWTDPEKLIKQISYLDANPHVYICYHNASLTDSSAKTVIREDILRSRYCVNYSSEALVLAQASLPTLTWVYRNLEFPDIKLFDLSKTGDRLRLVSIGLAGGQAHYLPDIQNAFYRTHAGGVWRGASRYERSLSEMHTYAILALHFERNNQRAISEFYLNKIFEKKLGLISFQQISYLYIRVLGGRVKEFAREMIDRLRAC